MAESMLLESQRRLAAARKDLEDSSSDESEDDDELEFGQDVKSSVKSKKPLNKEENDENSGNGDLISDEEVERLLSRRGADLEDIVTRRLGYDKEGFAGDEDDDKLQELPEIEREGLLFERSEKRRKLLETYKLKYKMIHGSDSAENLERKQSSRAGSDFSDAGSEESAEEDNDDFEEEESLKQLKISSRRDGKGRKSSKKVAKLQNSSSLIDVMDTRKLQVSRQTLFTYRNEPNFNDFTDCFVKVAASTDEANESTEYVLCQIGGFVQAERPYTMIDPGTNKKRQINRLIVIRHGKSEKEVEFSIVSDKVITEQEFVVWLEMMKETNTEIMGKDEAELLFQRIKSNIFEYVYSEKDIQAKVESRRKRRIMESKVNFTKERTELKRKIEYFSSSSDMGPDHEKMLRSLEEQLRALEERVSENATRKTKRRSVGKINMRNKLANVKSMEKQARKREEDEGDSVQKNPFSRQACRPKTLWATSNRESGITKPAETTKAAELNESVKKGGAESRKRPLIKPNRSLPNFSGVSVDMGGAKKEAGGSAKKVKASAESPFKVQQTLRKSVKQTMSLMDYYKKHQEE